MIPKIINSVPTVSPIPAYSHWKVSDAAEFES
jgi:hypothetical protein